MSKYIFYGQVLPERANVNISKVTCSYPDEKIEIILQCYYSKIVAECFCGDDSINILTLKNYVETAVRNIVDVIGYTVACGYDVEIESAYNLESNIILFGVHEPIFDDLAINENTSRGAPHPDIPDINKLVDMSGMNVGLRIALGDFREAIRQPSFTFFLLL